MSTKVCPVLHFRKIFSTSPDKEHFGIGFEARIASGKPVGFITVGYRKGTPPYVGFVEVDKDLQRCGVATQLYQKAAKVACTTFKQPLHSDIFRSREAQAFWAKQVAKGRATCVSRNDTVVPDDDSSRQGRGGCHEYKLRCPAPPDLSRAQTRKRK